MEEFKPLENKDEKKDILEGVSLVMDHLENKTGYEGEDVNNLRGDLFQIYQKLEDLRNSHVPDQIIDAVRRIEFLSAKNEENLSQDREIVLSDLYKIKKDIEHLSGNLPSKPDWLK